MYPEYNLKSRMRKYINILIPLLGVIIIATMLGLVWFWETSGRELYFYKEIVVLNQDVKRGTIITEEMLKNEKIEASKQINQTIIDKNQVIGLEAKHFIPENTQLHPFYFENPNLIAKENTYIVRIPNEWLYSIPDTLRRKDNILFYEIKSKLQTEEIKTYHPEEEKQFKPYLGQPVLTARVAYVKDSANREVQSLSSVERIDGSSVISEVLILTTPEEFQQLEAGFNQGNKFIIMYSDGEE